MVVNLDFPLYTIPKLLLRLKMAYILMFLLLSSNLILFLISFVVD